MPLQWPLSPVTAPKDEDDFGPDVRAALGLDLSGLIEPPTAADLEAKLTRALDACRETLDPGSIKVSDARLEGDTLHFTLSLPPYPENIELAEELAAASANRRPRVFSREDMCPDCRDEPDRDVTSYCVCPPDSAKCPQTMASR